MLYSDATSICWTKYKSEHSLKRSIMILNFNSDATHVIVYNTMI